jgi:hypothetical protein
VGFLSFLLIWPRNARIGERLIFLLSLGVDRVMGKGEDDFRVFFSFLFLELLYSGTGGENELQRVYAKEEEKKIGVQKLNEEASYL